MGKVKRKLEEPNQALKRRKLIETLPEAQWTSDEVLAERQNLNLPIAKNLVKLLEEENTVPFIARYRRHLTGNLSAEKLIEVKESFEEIAELRGSITKLLKTVKKNNQLNDNLQNLITSVRSIEELNYIKLEYTSKPGAKTLAAKAKELGLEEPALHLFQNTDKVDLTRYVNKDNNLATIEDVEKGIVHIIASYLATDSELLSFLRELKNEQNYKITSKKAKKTKNNVKVDWDNFKNYFDFEKPIQYIKPHQILAINRGENLKVLSVNIRIPEQVFQSLKNYCWEKLMKTEKFNKNRNKIIDEAIKDSYNRLIQPLIIREVRNELKLKADRASCEVFSRNLKKLLLTPPLKGKVILGIDPGFTNGCKLAVVSSIGDLLDYNVIYPFGNTKNKAVEVFRKMLFQNSCDMIALGNGTACRQTEEWLTELIKSNTLPLNVQYTIVNEDGSSIYSCSPEAKKEFPNLDPNIISAISLARRILNPLAELVKVEPHHLGIGMYQHDIKKKQLEQQLQTVVSECVSFVGVDLNTSSQCLLKNIAGLSDKKAMEIIKYRTKNGVFLNRKQLLKIPGIGERSFQQCAGFLWIGPVNNDNFYDNPETTKLDCTYIHPESYKLTEKLLKKFGLKVNDVGSTVFIRRILEIKPKLNFTQLKEEFSSNEDTIEFIFETLSKPLNYDLRNNENQAQIYFKTGITNIANLNIGTVLNGQVNNVTHFGCFVDIGVGSNGLIHSSKLKGFQLDIGDKVEVKVINVDIERKRITLEMMEKL